MARIDSLEHFLSDIATAIKNKINNNATIYPANFDTSINSITTLNAQTKTVSPSTSSQTITPDVNYNALSQVTVNAVTSSIDQNITAGNIKKDVQILGVTGTYEGGGSGSSIDWTTIGYQNDEPETYLDTYITDNYNKALDALTNWEPGISSLHDYFNSNYKNLAFIPLVDTSGETNAQSAFSGNSNLISVPLLDTSSVIDAQYMFQNCTSLITVPQFNTSSVTDMIYMFYKCSSLTTVPQFNTSSVNDMTGMFQGCENLTTVPQFNTSSVTEMMDMFGGCFSLSNESLNNILAMCINVSSSYMGDKTLDYIGLSSTQATTCQSLSNWNDFVAAGWDVR